MTGEGEIENQFLMRSAKTELLRPWHIDGCGLAFLMSSCCVRRRASGTSWWIEWHKKEDMSTFAFQNQSSEVFVKKRTASRWGASQNNREDSDISSKDFLSFRFLLVLIYFHINICTAILDLFVPELIYHFPTPTPIENLAVRSDGSILTITSGRAAIYLIQPSASAPNPQFIYGFNGSNVATKIVETSPDVFYVTVTNVTEEVAPITNRSQLWRIAFSSYRRYNTEQKTGKKFFLLKIYKKKKIVSS